MIKKLLLSLLCLCLLNGCGSKEDVKSEGIAFDDLSTLANGDFTPCYNLISYKLIPECSKEENIQEIKKYIKKVVLLSDDEIYLTFDFDDAFKDGGTLLCVGSSEGESDLLIIHLKLSGEYAK